MVQALTATTPWLAAIYVALLPFGRSGLPLNSQWGDLIFPLLALAVWVDGPPGGLRLGRRDWPLGAYLAVTLATALASPDPWTGFGHLAKQVYVALVFLVLRAISSDSLLVAHLQRVFAVMVAAVASASIFAVFCLESGSAPLSLLGWAGGPLPLFGSVLRLRGGLEAPEMLGNMLLVAFVVALGQRAAVFGSRRNGWAAALAVLAGAEFLTFSHSVAGFVVAAALFVSTSIHVRALRKALWAVAVSVVVLVNLASVMSPVRDGAPRDLAAPRVSLSVLGTRVDAELDGYLILKQVAWSVFTESPLTGVGPGRFTVENERAYNEGRTTEFLVWLRPHSTLLGRLAESGFLGGLSLIWLWVSWLRLRPGEFAAMEPARRAAFAAVVGLLVNSLNADVMNFRFLWVALAWALTLPVRRESSPAA